MKREKRLTKREKKAQAPRPTAAAPHDHQHIHCAACGRHLELSMFDEVPPQAAWLRCDHGSEFASCSEHVDKTRELLAEHDRTGQAVRHAAAWH